MRSIMIYSIKTLFSFLLIFFFLNEVSSQEIIINEKIHPLDDAKGNLFFANLEANSTLDITIDDSGSSGVQVGPFASSNGVSINVYCPIDRQKQIIHRFETANINCLNFKIELNGQLKKIILEIYGGKKVYIVDIVNVYLHKKIVEDK